MSHVNPPPVNLPVEIQNDARLRPFFKDLLGSVYLMFVALDRFTLTSGTGTPEGAVTGRVGDLFTRTDGGVGTTLYVKESGTGDTGWAAK